MVTCSQPSGAIEGVETLDMEYTVGGFAPNVGSVVKSVAAKAVFNSASNVAANVGLSKVLGIMGAEEVGGARLLHSLLVCHSHR